MSTNGAIAMEIDGKIQCVYHNWDSYPEGLGNALHEIYFCEGSV